MGPVEVITSVERRRHCSAAQKQAMVDEADEPGSSISSVARKYGRNALSYPAKRVVIDLSVQ